MMTKFQLKVLEFMSAWGMWAIASVGMLNIHLGWFGFLTLIVANNLINLRIGRREGLKQAREDKFLTEKEIPDNAKRFAVNLIKLWEAGHKEIKFTYDKNGIDHEMVVHIEQSK